MASISTNRIYDGVVFDESKGNYTEWLDSVYGVLRFLKLWRWAIPLKAGELGVRKVKPVGDEEKIEEWEDEAEKALAVIGASLGSMRWFIKDAKEPDQAFKAMHDRFSGATQHDAVKLETRWVNEKPKGDSFMQYIATMRLLKDKLERISITRTEKDLCLRMMIPLSQYSEGHPLKEAYKWLDNKFRESPSDITLDYFTRYIQSAVEKLADEDGNHSVTNKGLEDTHALLTMTRLVEKMENALAMSHQNRNNKPTSSGKSYSGCHFCKSQHHQIANCDDPKFDPSRWNRDRENAQRKRDNGNGQGREGRMIGEMVEEVTEPTGRRKKSRRMVMGIDTVVYRL
jgi:hypothetical protein